MPVVTSIEPIVNWEEFTYKKIKLLVKGKCVNSMLLIDEYFNQALVPDKLKIPIFLPKDVTKWVSFIIWDLVIDPKSTNEF